MNTLKGIKATVKFSSDVQIVGTEIRTKQCERVGYVCQLEGCTYSTDRVCKLQAGKGGESLKTRLVEALRELHAIDERKLAASERRVYKIGHSAIQDRVERNRALLNELGESE